MHEFNIQLEKFTSAMRRRMLWTWAVVRRHLTWYFAEKSTSRWDMVHLVKKMWKRKRSRRRSGKEQEEEE